MRTYSLDLRSRRLLRAIINASAGTPLGPVSTPQLSELRSSDTDLSSGEAEYADHARFFRHFRGRLSPDELAGQRLLDVGCGYGGRTVYYGECGATVHGIEIYDETVRRCEALARRKGSDATFSMAFAEELPFDDGSFDVVLSYDVLEHVDDPARAIAEMTRVLRPGGTFLAVFPTYKGARSAHLDYLTRVPALHRIFDPDVTVAVANEVLAASPDSAIDAQPAPRVSPLGVRTLPRLNGMTLRDARRLLSGLRVSDEVITPIVDPQLDLETIRAELGGWLAPAVLVKGIAHALDALPAKPDLLIHNIAVRATKPG
jgi:SAM-dependent methyltransferase